MPTLLRDLGYVFSFYSNESNEMPHLHVEKGNAEAKVWLEPEVREEYFIGFNPKEKKNVMKIIYENLETFKKKWYDHFNK